MMFHRYADDPQLYCLVDPLNNQNIEQTHSRREECISIIRSRMLVNRLKINESKTEFILLGTKVNFSKVPNLKIRVGEDVIHPTKCVGNSGSQLSSKC